MNERKQHDQAAPRRSRPNRFSAAELGRVGVTILDASGVRLRCKCCKQEWSPNVQPGGRMPSGYWRCPRGCNDLD
ncbi:MAG TPA: hypothetical protein VMT18_02755 [Planctomycetota bacterium]|nr:hypothetical protein [Planctomycetota bacterium]